MKKILLLTASYGSGHLTANKYVQNALIKLYSDKIQTDSIDFLKMESYIETANIYQTLYNKTMEKPKLWDIFFNITNNQISNIYFRITMPLFYNSIYEIFEKKSPDIFVATHPYWSFIIKPYRKKYNKKIPLVMIVTDSTAIHSTWIEDSNDYYVVIDEETKEVLINKGVSSEKIHVFGFPVNPELAKEFNRNEFLSDIDMNPDLPTLLFVIGLGAKEKFIDLIDLCNEKIPGHLYQQIVLVGKYRPLYDYLTEKTFSCKTHVVGWTDRVVDYMRASDIVISKGGGAIISETITAGKPVIVPVFVPGQEKGNTAYITKHNLGYAETSIENAFKIINDLISHPFRIKELQENVRKHSKPEAAMNIAKFIYSLL